jgi:DNA-binding response OmpR family regulator
MSAAGRDVADGSGADDFLDKPFYLDEVEALVNTWLPRDQFPPEDDRAPR